MAGSLIGAVTNGAYTKTAASQEATKSDQTTSTSKTPGKTGNEYDQEMFLQLLVAEMQYQDPLQPSDNKDYVAQLASFTQIEAIQSVQKDMASMQANSLVGKMVVINDNNTEVEGRVNYVTSDDDGTLYVNVNDKTYKVDDIDSVVDDAYYNAVTIVQTFNEMVAKLPSAEYVTLGDEKAITDVLNVYNSMDTYTQSYVDQKTVDYLKELATVFDTLKKAKEDADKEAAEKAAQVNNTPKAEDTTGNQETSEASDKTDNTGTSPVAETEGASTGES